MNEAAANALYDAERKGVRQIRGRLADSTGGMCAYGVLKMTVTQDARELLGVRAPICPMCGDPGIKSEAFLITHLNDDHRLTFAEIARKLGPDAA